MKVEDFTTVSYAKNEHEFEIALRRRYGNEIKEFWLSHEDDNHPAISILVNGDLASLHYFPAEHESGFRSVGKIESLKPGEMSIFFVSKTEEIYVINDSVVLFSAALTVAKEFFNFKKLPASIEWFEL